MEWNTCDIMNVECVKFHMECTSVQGQIQF